MEGATFDGLRLGASGHGSPSTATAPVCSMAWLPDPPRSAPSEDLLAAPLYWTKERQRLLAMVELPSGGENNKWLQAGVVLFLREVA